MRGRIHIRFLLISAIAVLITGVCGMIIFYNIFTNAIYSDLEAYSYIVAIMDHEALDGTASEDLKKNGIRITWIEEDGTVSYDSMQDKNLMDKHLDREEIQEAMLYGEGESMRRSSTSSEHTFYYATKLANGCILRVAKSNDGVFNVMVQICTLMLAVGIVAFVVCTLLARGLTKNLVEPVEKMAENIMLVADEDIYDEIKPFVSMIKQQHMDIMKHARMRQEFSANVSHELKTPLTAISGYAELIASGITSAEDTKLFARKIHSSAERLQHLINDTIELSKLDDSEYMLEVEVLDLYEMAKDCAVTMEFFAKKHEVTISVTGKHLIVNANKSLMEELLYNLCSNAIRYNKKGGKVTITTRMEENHPVLSVKDTGIGIPDKYQERVFERFYRVDKSHSKSTGGTGLGLAIVKHIVAQHDAQIVLESEVGIGTEIKIIF